VTIVCSMLAPTSVPTLACKMEMSRACSIANLSGVRTGEIKPEK
jgi:hypothetical protein